MRNSRSLLKFYFILLLFVILIIGCGVKSQYITSARIYMGLSPPDYEKALEQLKLELEHSPDNAEAYYLLGTIYSRKYDNEKMVEAFLKCKSLDPKWNSNIDDIISEKWISAFNSGVSFASRDSVKKALEKFETAILLDSTKYEAWLNGGVQAMKLNDCQKGMSFLDKAYQLKPEDILILNTYAQVSFNCREYAKSLETYLKVKEKDPKNVNVLVNIAMIYEQTEQPDSALVIYSRIIEIDPEYRDAYFNRGGLDWNRAQGIYKYLVDIRDQLENDPNTQTLIDSSKVLIEKQKELFSKAEKDFEKTLELDPQDQEAMQFLAYCLLSLDETDKAIGVLKQWIELDPVNKDAWSSLAIAYTKKGMKKEAEEAQKKAEGR
ncbi:MAG: hypothetical protein AMJ90_06190 [candidate division Zixibacteria bacterium SM23_73_2]|nr:MAG: hypothetical protein AMJ90_06190 [candidate division Zixibacteria bacterium SM23_73_2]